MRRRPCVRILFGFAQYTVDSRRRWRPTQSNPNLDTVQTCRPPCQWYCLDRQVVATPIQSDLSLHAWNGANILFVIIIIDNTKAFFAQTILYLHLRHWLLCRTDGTHRSFCHYNSISRRIHNIEKISRTLANRSIWHVAAHLIRESIRISYAIFGYCGSCADFPYRISGVFDWANDRPQTMESYNFHMFDSTIRFLWMPFSKKQSAKSSSLGKSEKIMLGEDLPREMWENRNWNRLFVTCVPCACACAWFTRKVTGI